MINEIQHEAKSTQRMLERLDATSFKFKPHERSTEMGKLARHIAEIPAWITVALTTPEFDLANRPLNTAEVSSTEEVLKTHTDNVAAAIKAIENASDEEMLAEWTLRRGDHVILKMPRVAVVRNMAMNHMVHHRGQLSVYMRLNNIPVPGVYGPSADEQ